MKFSIVIPVYKTEHLLKRCLDSFAAQTDGDFEVIVVDDASPWAPRGRDAPVASSGTGNSISDAAGTPRLQAAEIVSQYDARFKYVRHEANLSLFQARQTGLRMAQGEYVIPFDSDDYALPRLLEELRKSIGEGERRETISKLRSARDPRARPVQHCARESRALRFSPRDFEIASGDTSGEATQSNNSPDLIVYQMMYDDGKTITMPSVRYKNEILSGAEALDRFFASKIQCAICGKAVRREVYLKAMDELAAPRDFYLNSSEDLCQTFPVLMNAQSVATISYPGYRYWLNDDSLTTTLTEPAKLGKAAENTARVFALLKDFVMRREVKVRGEGEQWCVRLDRFMRPTLRWYLSCLRHLPEPQWRACVAELDRHFAPDLVAREAMLLIEESATYRFGKIFASALRIFRRTR